MDLPAALPAIDDPCEVLGGDVEGEYDIESVIELKQSRNQLLRSNELNNLEWPQGDTTYFPGAVILILYYILLV